MIVSWFSALAKGQEITDWMNVSISATMTNPIVEQYLEAADYSGFVSRSADKAEYSKMLPFINAEVPYRKDVSGDIVIPLPETAGEDMVMRYFIEGYADAVTTVKVQKGSEDIHVRNLVPQQTYLYEVVNADEELVTKGRIEVTGHLRMLSFDTGDNVRDIGGWQTNDGKRLCYGKIIRGSELKEGFKTTMSGEDIAALKALGVEAEIDFRIVTNLVPGELLTESPLGEGTYYLPAPQKDEAALLANARDEYKKAFMFLLEQLRQHHTVYVNCTYGADRTGVFCALIEALCGVSIGDIYKDYELSALSSKVGARYYYTINQRMVRPLYIFSAASVQSYVRSYMQNKLSIPSDTLDELVQLMTEEYDPYSAIDSPEADAVGVTNGKFQEGYYTLSGVQVEKPVKGINIIRYANGSTKKFFSF